MMDAHILLQSLALVLGTAALTSVACNRLRLPVVLGYLVAGFLVGPQVPFTATADKGIVQSLSELGVILLMFSIGLDFSIRKLFRVGPAAALIGLLTCGFTAWLGFTAADLLGWTSLECTFVAAIVAISSTTIVIRAFEEMGIGGNLKELVLGVLVVQDLIAIVVLAMLTTLATGIQLSAVDLMETAGKLLGFLVGLVIVGLWVIPPSVRAIVRSGRAEMTLIASVGFCFAMALLAQASGYSVALGAFLAGSLIAESGEEHYIASLIEPLRNVFAAIFFVSVGMLIDPSAMVEHAGVIFLLTLVVLVGQVTGTTLAGFLTGNGIQTSLRAGMCLAQIGEFSFIIAGLGISSGATGSHLAAVAVAVSVLTSLATPSLIRASVPAAEFIDRKLPKRMQVLVALYGSWIDRLRTTSGKAGPTPRRILVAMAIDFVLLVALTILAATNARYFVTLVQWGLDLPTPLAWALVLACTIAPAGPLCLGVMTNARRISLHFAHQAFPPTPDTVMDPANAPRGALIVVLQLGILSVLAIIFLTVTQPFVPSLGGVALVAPLLLIPLITLWKAAANLNGHVRAGVELIVEAINRKESTPSGDEQASALITQLLPGIGEPIPVHVPPQGMVVGRTLAELNLRGRTGATVLAIVRNGIGLPLPAATERLMPDDVLALAGSEGSIQLARTLLLSPGDGSSPNGSMHLKET